MTQGHGSLTDVATSVRVAIAVPPSSDRSLPLSVSSHCVTNNPKHSGFKHRGLFNSGLCSGQVLLVPVGLLQRVWLPAASAQEAPHGLWDPLPLNRPAGLAHRGCRLQRESTRPSGACIQNWGSATSGTLLANTGGRPARIPGAGK